MDPTPNFRMSASRKCMAATTGIQAPKKTIRHTSIAPPGELRRLHDILSDQIPGEPGKIGIMACIDCQLSDNIKSCTSKVLGRSTCAILQESFEKELGFRISTEIPASAPALALETLCRAQAQMQYRQRPRRCKSITWDSTVEFIDRAQKQINKYGQTGMVKVKKDWWKDPTQLKACECFLTTGKYLDALTALPCEDVSKVVSLLPPEIADVVMGISFKVGKLEELNADEYRIDMTEHAEDERLLNTDVCADPGDLSNKPNSTVESCDEDVTKLAAHRRLLAEYFDSRLDDRLFCRYSGRLKRPAAYPKIEVSTQNLKSVYAKTNGWGPTAHIVSCQTRSDRPLISPVRFSQTYMAMKFHRLGKGCASQVEFLNDLNGQMLELTNHCVVTEPFISDDRLLLRTQSWIYAHNLDPESKEFVQAFLNGNRIASYRRNDPMTWACRHLSTNPDGYSYDFDRPQEAAEFRRCTECAFEYQTDTLKSIPVNWTDVSPQPIAKGFCAVVTTWRDFGRCLTPYDPRWAAHFVEYSEPYFTSRFPAQNQQLRDPAEEEPANDWDLGGILRAYEGCDELIETERSLHRSVLKFMLSTEKQIQVWKEVDERKEKLRELKRQRQRGL